MAVEHDIVDDNVGNMIAKLLPAYINPITDTLDSITPMGIDIIPNYDKNECLIRNLYRVVIVHVLDKEPETTMLYVVLDRVIKYELGALDKQTLPKSSSDMAIADNQALLQFNEDTSMILERISKGDESWLANI